MRRDVLPTQGKTRLIRRSGFLDEGLTPVQTYDEEKILVVFARNGLAFYPILTHRQPYD